jgi:mono/diheme cytochrome c family protein
MAAAIFLGFFVVLGLGVVLVAMRGGPRGVRDTLERGRRRPMHTAEFAIVGVIALFGVAVPVGRKLSSDLANGRKLFNAKCATCHTLKDAGAVGRVGPNLDQLAPTSGLTLSAIRDGRARGQGQMPAQLLNGQDARNVARYIEAVAGR